MEVKIDKARVPSGESVTAFQRESLRGCGKKDLITCSPSENETIAHWLLLKSPSLLQVTMRSRFCVTARSVIPHSAPLPSTIDVFPDTKSIFSIPRGPPALNIDLPFSAQATGAPGARMETGVPDAGKAVSIPSTVAAGM
jgi:hypothetical protein